MSEKTKRVTTIGMLAALAYLVMVVIRVPVVLFLKYEPKDIIITLGGFILGPMASFLISVIVSIAEMVTVSDTGPIGCLMNLIASCSFACVASFIYKKKHNLKGAVIGLLSGIISMTVVMLIWNYLITPIYLGYQREVVAGLLVPAFLPFNLLKGGINATITMLIYRPLVTGLRKARLIPESKGTQKGNQIGIMLVCLAILITCIVTVLVWNGTI